MKNKKALLVATVAAFIASFEIDDINRLQSLGYEVHVATNYSEIKDSPKKRLFDSQQIVKHNIPFTRNPLSKENIKAYKMLKQIMTSESFDIIHCHTPVGGAITRMVNRRRKNSLPKVIYTAHGLHFFKGAPIKNWILYFPVEWLLSWRTDVFVAINHEDYEFANKHLHAKKTIFLPGIGIEVEKFSKALSNRENIRQTLGIDDETIMVLSVGELCQRKNHKVIIDAFSHIDNPYVRLYIAGTGVLERALQEMINEKGFEKKISLLGYRTDIVELCIAADMFILPSLQEGLPVALMEAIASRTPIICSKIRGSVDLLSDMSFAFDPHNSDELAKVMNRKIGKSRGELASICEKAINNNYANLGQYSKENVNDIMLSIYSNC